ncbi:MAG: helix-turn-helix domain-containing protein [Sphingomonas bacterium]|nr:helix-turn-helix domain-containing protein [Sphingomonas bacterium]
MKIGELARVTGVKAETVRFYERIGLLPAPDRTVSNYRDYGADDRERVLFIRNARRLGFEIADLRSLLGLAQHPEMDCGEVDRIATGHLEAVDQKIVLLGRLRTELRRMISQCRGRQLSDCRIMNSLVDDGESGESGE